MNFAKFLRTPFFTEHLRWLLLILSCLNMNKAAAMDQVSTKFPKETADVLAYSLPRINLSVKLFAFPEECKIATLKLLFKKS